MQRFTSWFIHHKPVTFAGLTVLIVAAVGLIIIASGHKPIALDNTTTATNDGGQSLSVSGQPVDEGQQQPTDPNPHFSDGTYLVGQDIQPGTYRTRQSPTTDCYYARLNSVNTDDILANDNTYAPAVITISASDKAFISKGCGTWTEDLSAITTDKTSFSDGIFIVGTDINPGTYKSTGQTGCYWARLSDFSGGGDNIIDNDYTNDPAAVTILSTDKGFKSSHCGTWTLQP